MSAPPTDGPSPAAAQQAAANASMAAGPPVANLCGFKIPSVSFSFGFSLPALPSFPPTIPAIPSPLGISCTAHNPLDVVGNGPWGGGRVGSSDPDPDDVLDQQTSS